MRNHHYRHPAAEYESARYRAQAPARRGANRTGGGTSGGRARSFLIGTQDVLEGSDYDQTFVNTAGGAVTPWTLQATGWLARLWLRIDYTTTGGTALTADAPFIMFSSVQLNDVNNEAGRDRRVAVRVGRVTRDRRVAEREGPT